MYIKAIDFASRPGLSGFVRKFADLFEPAYSEKESDEDKNQAGNAIAKLHTKEGDPMKGHGMILDLLLTTAKSIWPTDDEAKTREILNKDGNKTCLYDQ
ncbi:hypothetical protein ACEPAH_3084 [Sanghuangporus vaninii]